ncbi:MAG: hypothetical protein RO009_05525 [Pseudorhodoplanes sp.]|jgi:hypothetical protein|nr:hypothetical protein [Pseudorhodoplanes sp.]
MTMTERPKSAAEQARTARLGKALRENLKRRKAQLRGRDASDKADKPQDPALRRPDR